MTMGPTSSTESHTLQKCTTEKKRAATPKMIESNPLFMKHIRCRDDPTAPRLTLGSLSPRPAFYDATGRTEALRASGLPTEFGTLKMGHSYIHFHSLKLA